MCLPNLDHSPRPEPLDQPAQSLALERDAAGRRKVFRAREMNEYRAAAPGDARTPVMIDFNNNIIEMVGPDKTVSGCPGRPSDRAVVIAVGRVFRPRVVWPNPAQGKECAGRQAAVGTPPDSHRTEPATRRPPIPLAFIGDNAGSPERSGNGGVARDYNALALYSWPPMYANEGES